LQGDVVGRTPLPGQLHQGGAAFRWWIPGHGGLQFFLGHNTPKTVGAKQEMVSLLQGQGPVGTIDRQFPSRS